VKAALTVWENRISPVFDSARMVLVVKIQNGAVVSRHYEILGSELPLSRVSELARLEVKILICGAISRFFANIIEAHGIRIIPFVMGDVNQVLDAYLKGLLITPSFQMPGCGMKLRRRFRGGRD
jgi:predicted Fe-Mo cluster-binding NifX family protein